MFCLNHFDPSWDKNLYPFQAGLEFEVNQFVNQNDDTQFRCHELRINVELSLYELHFFIFSESCKFLLF